MLRTLLKAEKSIRLPYRDPTPRFLWDIARYWVIKIGIDEYLPRTHARVGTGWSGAMIYLCPLDHRAEQESALMHEFFRLYFNFIEPGIEFETWSEMEEWYIEEIAVLFYYRHRRAVRNIFDWLFTHKEFDWIRSEPTIRGRTVMRAFRSQSLYGKP